MKAIGFDLFFTAIAPRAPGASDIAIENALRDAAIEFCVESLVWTAWSDPSPVLANINEYDIDVPRDADVTRVLMVQIEGHTIDPVPFDSMDSLYNNWRAIKGRPNLYTQDDPTVLRLVPTPSERMPAALTYRCAFQPTATAQTLPDILFRRYREAVAAGALYRLLSTPDKPYTNPELAAMHYTRFQDAMTDAGIDQFKNFGRAPLRTRGTYF